MNFEPQFETEVKKADKEIEVFDQAEKTNNAANEANSDNVPDYNAIMQQVLNLPSTEAAPVVPVVPAVPEVPGLVAPEAPVEAAPVNP